MGRPRDKSGSSPLTRGKRVRGAVNVDDTGLIPAHAGKTICLGTTRSVAWAHPRSRGENKDLGHMKYLTSGSSPLTRGKLNRRDKPLATAGLIPAHAGKTCPRSSQWRSRAAHPRSRGENKRQDHCLSCFSGSSPLTRGKRPHVARFVGEERLIPAHAGKTAVIDTLIADRAAHPRSRGENRLLLPQRPVERGSSPLTRGKRGPLPRPLGRVRLIPAHAGKTVKFGYTNRDGSAHPRSRGENGLGVGRLRCGCGSSPLTRGKLITAATVISWFRLIPAHAGKTCWRRYQSFHPGAHPRSRGENAMPAGIRTDTRGSSPLTRGKRQRSGWSFSVFRLIPAHAGKTLQTHEGSTHGWAHPRSRGENGGTRGCPHGLAGSSPLTRGKRPAL